MNKLQYDALNGEQLLHTVWIIRDGQPYGIRQQTISDVQNRFMGPDKIVKIECEGHTEESVVRECNRWGCE